MNKIIYIFIGISIVCCSRNEQQELESISKYLNQREILKKENKISIGNNLEEITSNLQNVVTYSDLLNYVPRIIYKSNIQTRIIGQEFIEIREDLWNCQVEPPINVNIRYLVKRDTIRFAVIDRINIDSLYFPDNLIVIKDEVFIDKTVKSHNRKFNSQQNLKSFIEAYEDYGLLSQFDHKGLAIEGSKMKKMFVEMQNGGSDNILHLLKSINPVDQAIGVIGVYIMKDLEREIKPLHLHYMNLIINSHHEFYANMGCTRELVDIEQYLSMINWEMVININFEQKDGD